MRNKDIDIRPGVLRGGEYVSDKEKNQRLKRTYKLIAGDEPILPNIGTPLIEGKDKDYYLRKSNLLNALAAELDGAPLTITSGVIATGSTNEE